MKYELCIACDHCDPSNTNDRQQVFCEINPPYVDPFNGCDEFANKALDECFKNIGKSDKNIGKSELNAKEIIKAFNSIIRERCDDCPFKTCYDCEISVGRSALDLINRQHAKIERLQAYYDDMQSAIYSFREDHAKVKFFKGEIIAEAIKEFAKRLKRISRLSAAVVDGREIHKIIDNLVQEMAGEQDETERAI